MEAGLPERGAIPLWAAEKPRKVHSLMGNLRFHVQRTRPDDILSKDHIEETIGHFSIERFEHRIFPCSLQC